MRGASVKQTKSGRWQVRFRYGGKMPGPTFEDRADAEDYAHYVRRCLDKGDPILLPREKIGGESLADFHALWLSRKRNLAQRSVRLYQSLFEAHVLEQIGHLPLRAITVRVMDDWQEERLAAGAGPEAIAKTGKMLHQVFKQAHRYEMIERNPATGMDRPRSAKKPVVPATPLQVESLRWRFFELGKPRYAALVSVMAYAGLRVGEAFALTWEDLIQGKKLWVARSLNPDGSFKSTKTENNRVVELPEAVVADLLSWRRESATEGLIFPRPLLGGSWTDDDRGNWRHSEFTPAARSVGLKGPPKDLRHSCASLMIAAGRPPTEVADYLGHDLLTSIRTYQHLIDQMKGEPVRPVDEHIAEARGTLEAQLRGEQVQTDASEGTPKPEISA